MLRMLGMMLVAVLVFAGCGEDEEPSGLETFCAEYKRAGTTGGIEPAFSGADRIVISEALLFFRRLEAAAPPQIEQELSTLTTGLDRVAEAFADFQGTEGQNAIEAVHEAADVDFEEMSRAAEDVRQFAVANCDGVEPAE